MTLPILLLAAGRSSRMRGLDKLLEPVAGRALLRQRAETALAVSPLVLVTLPGASLRAAALAGLPVTRLTVPDPGAGMSASLRTGISALGPAEAVMVLLADMPEIDAADLATMIAAADAHPGEILCGSDVSGRPGHPVIFPGALLPELAAQDGDKGGRALIRAHGMRPVPLPDAHAFTDLDTPEDWDEWRARQDGSA